MARFSDFVVPYSSDVVEQASAILEHLTIYRAKNNKPTIVLLTGASGEAKSLINVAIADLLCKKQGYDLLDYLDKIEVFTPLEYATKVKALLFAKDLKKINFVIIDEGREVIDARKWQDFINQAIAHVNAMSREIKPLVVFIITQSIMDIDPSVRRTLTFYGKCVRPMKQTPFLYLFRVWIDDKDLQNPKLRKRKVVGYVVKDGRYIKVYPVFRFHMPRKELVTKYKTMNFEAKVRIINRKMDALLHKLALDTSKDTGEDKLRAMAAFYLEKPEMLDLIIERKYNKVSVKKDVLKMHDLTPSEAKDFEKILISKLTERGIADAKERSEDNK